MAGNRSFVHRDATYYTMTVYADSARMEHYDPLWDTEVLRNATIQRTAESLRDIDRLYQAKRYQEAWELAYRLEQDLREVARLTHEDQIIQDANLMRRYQDTLARWVQNQTGRSPQPPESALSERPIRGRQTANTGDIPVLEPR